MSTPTSEVVLDVGPADYGPHLTVLKRYIFDDGVAVIDKVDGGMQGYGSHEPPRLKFHIACQLDHRAPFLPSEIRALGQWLIAVADDMQA